MVIAHGALRTAGRTVRRKQIVSCGNKYPGIAASLLGDLIRPPQHVHRDSQTYLLGFIQFDDKDQFY
jgi:hypothetical protein